MHAPSRPAESGLAPERTHPMIVALCMIVTVVEGYTLIVYGVVVPLLLRDPSLGVTDEATGLIGGVIYIGAIMGAILAPLTAERLGKKRVLVIAIAVFAFATARCGAATSGEMLGAARFLVGLGSGAALTTAMTVARNSASARRASLVVTITMAGIPLGGVVAALVAIPVLPAFGWRMMFFIGTGMALAILAAVVLTPIPTDTAQEVAARTWTGRQKLATIFTGRGAVVAAIVALCAIANMVAWQGLNVWIVESMIGLGFVLQAALLFSFALTGAAVLGSFATAWAADRWGASLTAVFTASCTVAGLVGMLVLPASVPTAVACIGLMGIGGHSTMNLVHTATSDIYPLPARAAALGWSNGTSFVGAFLGPTVGGVVMASGGSHGIFAAFAVTAGICLLAVFGLFVADRKFTHTSFRHPDGRHGAPLVVSQVLA